MAYMIIKDNANDFGYHVIKVEGPGHTYEEAQRQATEVTKAMRLWRQLSNIGSKYIQEND